MGNVPTPIPININVFYIIKYTELSLLEVSNFYIYVYII